MKFLWILIMSVSVLIDIRNLEFERIEVSSLIVSVTKIIKTLKLTPKVWIVVFKDKDISKELGMDFTYNGVICWKNSNLYSVIKQLQLKTDKIVVVTNNAEAPLLISNPIVICLNFNYKNAINFHTLPGSGYDRYPNTKLWTEKINKVYCFIDWQNIQVPTNEISGFLKNLKRISSEKIGSNIPVHTFVFLSSLTCNRKKLTELQKILYKEDAHCMYVEHKKPGAADAAILVSAESYMEPGCGLIMVSGDIDFSPYLTKVARNGNPVILIYNSQTWNTYRANKHFIYSENIDNLKNPKPGIVKNSNPSEYKTKVCRHYNYNICKDGDECQFLHQCHCGESHSYQTAHPNENILDKIPCTKWNFGECKECSFAHICCKCFAVGHNMANCNLEFKCISCIEKIGRAHV